MQAQKRLHAMDAVRTFALLLGIVLHGTMSFMPGITGAGFPIVDTSQSEVLGLVFYVIHIFRMATFFLIAGFFAHLVFHRKGAGTFIRDRRQRILYPLLIWWFPVMLCILLVFGIAFSKQGLDPNHVDPPAAPYPALIPFPLTHLWFLYVLLWFYVLILAGRYLFHRLPQIEAVKGLLDRAIRWLFETRTIIIALAFPVTFCLWMIPDWRWWSGVPTPDYSLDPNPWSFSIYGLFFTLGWLMDRQHGLLQRIRSAWVWYALAGIVMTAICLGIAGWRSGHVADIARTDHVLIYAACYAVATGALTFAFIGAGLTFFDKGRAWVRYLADGSYWIYVWHMPLVLLFQTLLMDVPLHWSLKFPLIMVLTLLPLLITYNWMVRPTFVGALMNGRKYTRGLPVVE